MIDRRERPDEVAALLEQHRRRLLRQVDLCNRCRDWRAGKAATG